MGLNRACAYHFEYLQNCKRGALIRDLTMRIIAPDSDRYSGQAKYELTLVAKLDVHGHTSVEQSSTNTISTDQTLLDKIRSQLESNRPLMRRVRSSGGQGNHYLNFKRVLRSKSQWTIQDLSVALHTLTTTDPDKIEWSDFGEGLLFSDDEEERQFIEYLVAELSLRQRSLAFVESYGEHRTLFDILYPN